MTVVNPVSWEATGDLSSVIVPSVLENFLLLGRVGFPPVCALPGRPCMCTAVCHWHGYPAEPSHFPLMDRVGVSHALLVAVLRLTHAV